MLQTEAPIQVALIVLVPVAASACRFLLAKTAAGFSFPVMQTQPGLSPEEAADKLAAKMGLPVTSREARIRDVILDTGLTRAFIVCLPGIPEAALDSEVHFWRAASVEEAFYVLPDSMLPLSRLAEKSVGTSREAASA